METQMDVETKRRLLHFSAGLFIVYLILSGLLTWLGNHLPFTVLYFLPPLSRPFLPILTVGGILILLSRKYKVPGLNWLLKNFERKSVRHKFPGKGTFFYVLGVFTVSVFFEHQIAAASIFVLSIGDPLSAAIGERYGKESHPLSTSKSIEGTITGALASGVGASIILGFGSPCYPFIAFSASFSAMFLEGIDFEEEFGKFLDDNVVVPIVAAVVMFSLTYLVG